MPTYAVTITDEQDVVLQALATAEGYPAAQAYIDVKAAEVLGAQMQSHDDGLIYKARRGEKLTVIEAARVKLALGLS